MNLKPESTIVWRVILRPAAFVCFLLLAASAQAQFYYVTNNGTITITAYYKAAGGVTIPDTTNGLPVTGIGDGAFSDCWNLTNVTIPDSVVSIGENAFADCPLLTNITVADQNPAYASIDGVLFSKDATSLIQYPSGRASGSYVVPDSVTSIGDCAFCVCPGLTSVTIPNSVTNIAEWAFELCTGLTSATIPNGVSSIEHGAFQGCTNLASVTIPSSVTSIGEEAFVGCTTLTNVSILSSVTSIGEEAFAGCTRLTSVTFANGLTSIGSGAFEYCSSLTNVLLGDSVPGIGDSAFEDCGSLTSVTIPNSVTSIGGSVFFDCASLTKALFQGNAPTVNYGADTTVFFGESGTVYYLPGTTGWTNTFGGWPTAPWYQPNPQILGNGNGLGVQSNQFSFTISWATNISVVVEACSNLANPVWMPVATNALSNGAYTFSDPQWTNYPSRFYRVRSQ